MWASQDMKANFPKCEDMPILEKSYGEENIRYSTIILMLWSFSFLHTEKQL
jgi:hypothetical protein